MVTKSKGCVNCIRRKVRCDEGRPHCNRCERAHLDCGGYVREHRFVDEVARTVRHVQKKASQSPSSTNPRDLITRPSKPQALPRDLSLTAFEDNTTISFLLHHIFSGFYSSPEPWIFKHAGNTTSLTAQSSIRALSKVYFGRIHRQQGIFNQGLSLYGDALKGLNRDLQNKETAWSEQTMTSAMTLELYEFIGCSSRSSWLQHAGGVGRLLQLRGPWRHQSRYARHLLEANRVIIAAECIVKRKRCFLETPDWKTIPWALDPESKSPIQHLHDILCSLPGLMEDAVVLQNLTQIPDQFISLYQALSDKIESCFAELYAWRMLWEDTNPSACFEVPSSLLSAEEEPIFPTILHYTSLNAAIEITTYNTILLLLYKLGSDVKGSSFSPRPPISPAQTTSSNQPLCLPDHGPSPREIATEICRSADYHLLEKQRSAGAFCLLFPLRVAYQTFDNGAAEKRWLDSCMARIAELSGWEIGRHIGGDAAVGR